MNKITLTADAEIDPNGFRVFINKTLFSCGVSDINDAMRAERLADAEQNLARACEEIISLTRMLEEQTTIALFWRQAAEHAVTGWNALEDKHDLLLETLRALTKDEASPPTAASSRTEETVDLGFGPCRLLEEETPIPEKK